MEWCSLKKKSTENSIWAEEMKMLEKGKLILNFRSLTRDGITKELCDNIQKEIEKLWRQ